MNKLSITYNANNNTITWSSSHYTFFQPLMNNVWPISTIKWLLKQSMAFKTISQNLMNNWQQLFNSLHLFSSIWPSKTVCKCFNQFRSYYDNCDSFMNNYTELLNSFQNCSTVCKTIKQAFLWRKIIFFLLLHDGIWLNEVIHPFWGR